MDQLWRRTGIDWVVDIVEHNPRDVQSRQRVVKCKVTRSEYDGQKQTTCIEARPTKNIMLTPEMQYAICVESFTGDTLTPICVVPFGLADLQSSIKSKNASGDSDIGGGGTGDAGGRMLSNVPMHGPPLHSLFVHLQDNNHFLGKIASYHNLVTRFTIVFSTRE